MVSRSFHSQTIKYGRFPVLRHHAEPARQMVVVRSGSESRLEDTLLYSAMGMSRNPVSANLHLRFDGQHVEVLAPPHWLLLGRHLGDVLELLQFAQSEVLRKPTMSSYGHGNVEVTLEEAWICDLQMSKSERICRMLLVRKTLLGVLLFLNWHCIRT